MTSSAHLHLTPRFVFDDGQAYESMMGQWSALVAEHFLDWLALPEGLVWLDDGCGNGSFTEVLVSRQRPLSVVGVDPSPAQLAFARKRAGTARASFVEGDAQALPLADASVDAAVMALVLFFLPEPERGLRELARVVRPGGTIAAYHWDIEGGGFPLEPIVEALRAEGYQTHRPPSTWAASLEASENLWHSAGLVDVQTSQIRVRRGFDSFEDFWRTAYGSARWRDLFTSISPADLQRLRARLCDGLNAGQGAPLVLEARANAVKGRRP
jgi:SAM-dependent methyltransferase